MDSRYIILIPLALLVYVGIQHFFLTTKKKAPMPKPVVSKPEGNMGDGKPTPNDVPPPPPPVQPADTPSGINWIKWLIIIAVLAGIVALFWHLNHVGTEIAMRQAAEERIHPKPKPLGIPGINAFENIGENALTINGKRYPVLQKANNDFVILRCQGYEIRLSMENIPGVTVPGLVIAFYPNIPEAQRLRSTAEKDLADIAGLDPQDPTSLSRLCRMPTGEYLIANPGAPIDYRQSVDFGFSQCKRGKPIK